MLSGYKRNICQLCLAIFLASTPVMADKIHDPTLPKRVVSADPVVMAESVQMAEALSLQSIVTKRNKRMAIISGQLHQVGDEVGGYQISQINKDHVVLTKSGSLKRLYVYE